MYNFIINLKSEMLNTIEMSKKVTISAHLHNNGFDMAADLQGCQNINVKRIFRYNQLFN